MKTKCSQDVINLVESFLDISDKGVSLKNNNNYNIGKHLSINNRQIVI